MMAANLDDVVKLAEQLDSAEQDLLIYRLRVRQAAQKAREQTAQTEETESVHDEWFLARGSEYVEFYRDPTREELIDELNTLRHAGTLKGMESLYGKYANPNAPVTSEEAFHAQLHSIATEWEQELDDLDAD